MSTADTTKPGDNMTNVSPPVTGGPRLNVDNGNGTIRSYNTSTDVVSIPNFEVAGLTRNGIVT